MHKKKLVFLSILSSVLLYVLFTTSSLAWTWEDFKDFIKESPNTTNSNLNNGKKWFNNNVNRIEQDFNTFNFNPDDYDCFLLTYSSPFYNIQCFTLDHDYRCTSDGYVNMYNGNNQYAQPCQQYTYRYSTGSYPTAMSSSYAGGVSTGLLSKEPYNQNYYNIILQNAYNYIVCDDYIEITSIQRYMGSMRLGIKTQYDPTCYLYQGNNRLNVRLELSNATSVNGGLLYQVILPNDMGNYLNTIISSTDYTIQCWDGENLVVTSNIFEIKNSLPNITVVPIGQITNASGDITGNISLDGVVSAIQDGDAAILEAITSSEVKSGDELTSGDLDSFSISIGEESGEKLGQTKEFFTWVLTEFKSILEDNSNTTLDIPIYNIHNEVRSDFFVLPNGILRTFISAGWWFIVGVPFIKYIRRTIQKIKGGDIPNSDEKSDLLGNIL